MKFTIEVGAAFRWNLQIAGDWLDSDSSPLASLPQILDTARKVSTVIEGVQFLPTNMMWDLPVVSIVRLTGRIKALSALPHGKFCRSSWFKMYPFFFTLRLGGYHLELLPAGV